jgi:hypothetical protein
VSLARQGKVNLADSKLFSEGRLLESGTDDRAMLVSKPWRLSCETDSPAFAALGTMMSFRSVEHHRYDHIPPQVCKAEGYAPCLHTDSR